MIDSKKHWWAGKKRAGEWMQINLGAVREIVGTAAQTNVKTYTIKISSDGDSFHDVLDSKAYYPGDVGTYLTNRKEVRQRTAKNLFHDGRTRKARYVRFYIQTLGDKGDPKMQADVLLLEKKYRPFRRKTDARDAGHRYFQCVIFYYDP